MRLSLSTPCSITQQSSFHLLLQICCVWPGVQHVPRVLCLCSCHWPKTGPTRGFPAHSSGGRRWTQWAGRSFPQLGSQCFQGEYRNTSHILVIHPFILVQSHKNEGKWRKPNIWIYIWIWNSSLLYCLPNMERELNPFSIIFSYPQKIVWTLLDNGMLSMNKCSIKHWNFLQ